MCHCFRAALNGDHEAYIAGCGSRLREELSERGLNVEWEDLAEAARECTALEGTIGGFRRTLRKFGKSEDLNLVGTGVDLNALARQIPKKLDQTSFKLLEGKIQINLTILATLRKVIVKAVYMKELDALIKEARTFLDQMGGIKREPLFRSATIFWALRGYLRQGVAANNIYSLSWRPSNRMQLADLKRDLFHVRTLQFMASGNGQNLLGEIDSYLTEAAKYGASEVRIELRRSSEDSRDKSHLSRSASFRHHKWSAELRSDDLDDHEILSDWFLEPPLILADMLKARGFRVLINPDEKQTADSVSYKVVF